jgi:hypothetical protein
MISEEQKDFTRMTGRLPQNVLARLWFLPKQKNQSHHGGDTNEMQDMRQRYNEVFRWVLLEM